MPELPEVETIVRTFRPRLAGQRITRFTSSWPKHVLPSYAAVRRRLAGRTIDTVTRRGKFIILTLDNASYLLIHLRMSGRFEWFAPDLPQPDHVRATWDLATGDRLLFCDARKFGRIVLTRDLPATLADLGPEPLSRGFTLERFQSLLAARNRQMKPLLLDQSVIAGLGNIYTDESLFRAGVHPCRPSRGLTAAESSTLHTAIRAVLREAIRRHGTSIDWIYPGGWMQRHLRVYGRAGQPCVTCQTPIERIVVGQRGTHICPHCQRLRRCRRRG